MSPRNNEQTKWHKSATIVIYYILICIGCKILRKHNGALSLLHWHQYYVEHSWTLGNDRQDRCLGGFCHECHWHVARHTEIIINYYLIASQKKFEWHYMLSKLFPRLRGSLSSNNEIWGWPPYKRSIDSGSGFPNFFTNWLQILTCPLSALS